MRESSLASDEEVFFVCVVTFYGLWYGSVLERKGEENNFRHFEDVFSNYVKLVTSILCKQQQ